MTVRAEAQPRAHRGAARALRVGTVGLLLAAVAACGGSDDSSEPSDAPETDARAELLGPEEPATGEPVRIGIISDGSTPAYDASDELRAADATVEFWNRHRGGIGGRPIELVTCETAGDPAHATDCGNRMVEDGVVAVVFSNSGVGDSAWEPLHRSGIPTMFFQTSGDAVTRDPQSTFVLVNPLPAVFGLPLSVAENEGSTRSPSSSSTSPSRSPPSSRTARTSWSVRDSTTSSCRSRRARPT